MKKMILLIAIMAFTACATSQKYDEKLDKLVGTSEKSLIESWGTPSAEKYLSKNSKIITYTNINEWFYPSEYYVYNNDWVAEDVEYAPFMGEYDFGPYMELTDNEVEEVCQTSFWVKNGIITAWKWRGNNCVAD